MQLECNFWKIIRWIFRWQGNYGLEKTSLYLFLIQINISEVVYFLVKCLCTIILFFLTFLKGQVFRLHVWTKESSSVSPLNTLFCSMEREYRVCSRMINQFMASWVKNDLWQSRVIFGRGFTWNIVEIWNPWGKIFLYSSFKIWNFDTFSKVIALLTLNSIDFSMIWNFAELSKIMMKK